MRFKTRHSSFKKTAVASGGHHESESMAAKVGVAERERALRESERER